MIFFIVIWISLGWLAEMDFMSRFNLQPCLEMQGSNHLRVKIWIGVIFKL